MEKIVRVGVAIVVCNGPEYLLIKRSGPLGPDTWCPPGGKIEFGETIEQCALRELKEEVGDDIVITEPIFHCITNDFFEKEQQHYITIHMLAQYIEGEPIIKEPDKCSGIGWFHQDDLDKMNLFLPVKNFLDVNKSYTT
jgi:8-oxo-dGTP diphosphatase